jgi:hypothetical protein
VKELVGLRLPGTRWNVVTVDDHDAAEGELLGEPGT